MKTNRIIKTLSSFLLLLMASGCLEYTVTTRIMPDGSIERIILVKGDSASVFSGSLPVPADTTWEITWGHTSGAESIKTDKETFFYKARKVYRNDTELNKEINSGKGGSNIIRRQVKVEKRFRWFYTFYHYRETYFRIFPFSYYPVDDYLNDEELEIVHAGNDELLYLPDIDKLTIRKDTLPAPVLSQRDSARMNELKQFIEKKYSRWLRINWYHGFFDVLKTAVINTGKLKVPELDSTRENLFAFLDHNIDDKTFLASDSAVLLLLQLSSVFYSIDSVSLRQANRAGFDSLITKQNNMLTGFDDSFTNETIMPGIILSTNSVIVNGNMAKWELEAIKFFEKDYTLRVESRVANKGMMILTGILVLLMLTGLLIGILRKMPLKR